jgi:hypothetical protein
MAWTSRKPAFPLGKLLLLYKERFNFYSGYSFIINLSPEIQYEHLLGNQTEFCQPGALAKVYQVVLTILII